MEELHDPKSIEHGMNDHPWPLWYGLIAFSIVFGLLLWLITYCAESGTRLQLQAAGDAVAAAAAIASLVTLLVVVRQLQLQKAQMKQQADDVARQLELQKEQIKQQADEVGRDRAERRQHAELHRIDLLARTYAEWAACKMNVILLMARRTSEHLIIEADNRCKTAENTALMTDPRPERWSLISIEEYPPFPTEVAETDRWRDRCTEITKQAVLMIDSMLLGDRAEIMGVPRDSLRQQRLDVLNRIISEREKRSTSAIQ